MEPPTPKRPPSSLFVVVLWGPQHYLVLWNCRNRGWQSLTLLSLFSGLDGKTMDYTDVSNTFVRLADTHFVQRCPLIPETPETPDAPPPPAPILVINEKDMYVVPRLNLIGKKALGVTLGATRWLVGCLGSAQPHTVHLRP